MRIWSVRRLQHRTLRRAAIVGLGSAALMVACAGNALAAEPILPIPLEVDVNPQKVALGRMLFNDPRLSKDGTVSCSSCHELAKGGADGRRVSLGVGGAEGKINSPTVYNTAGNFRQFWDGRADDLHAQIDGPLQADNEMAGLWPDVVTKLYSDPDYPGLFDAIYPDGINRDSIRDAIVEFERQLISPNSRFDKWLRGDASALSERELRGYELFKQYGCASCHQGANVGGNMFQVFGVLNSYFEERGNITPADMGRFNVTGNEADKHAFKVPSLRLAALTPPYLHDGSAATLRDAVDKMFRYQLGREAPDDEKDDIVEFIKTLAGELQGYQE